jgi:hypothetical protein
LDILCIEVDLEKPRTVSFGQAYNMIHNKLAGLTCSDIER